MTTLTAQAWILHTQIAEELLASARYDITICDRSVLDNFVYMIVSQGAQQRYEAIVDDWLKTYDLLVQVPIVEGLSIDGLRSTDPAFQLTVEKKLSKEIRERKLSCLQLDPSNRDVWLDTVESAIDHHIRPAQLELI